MSATSGRSIRTNFTRTAEGSINAGTSVTFILPRPVPWGGVAPGRIVTTIGRSDRTSTSAWTFSFRIRRVGTSRPSWRSIARQFVTRGKSIAPARAGARSVPCAVWATRTRRGFVDSTIPRTAWTYASPVYPARRGRSARRTSTVYPARWCARSLTPCPRTTSRTSWRSTLRIVAAAMSSSVEGATRPSRCSAITRTPATGSPPNEALLPEELRELLRLLGDRPGDHLRVALRDGRGEADDAERVRQRDGVPPGEAEGRRAELPDRLPRRLHDRGQGSVPGRVRAELDRDKRGSRERDPPLEPALELARDLEPAVRDRDPGHDARVGESEEARDQASGRGVRVVVGLHAREDDVVGQRPDRGREDPRVLPDVERGGGIVRYADRLVRALRERLPEHRLRPLRAEGERDDAAAVPFFQPHGLLEGVLVRPVHLDVHALASDVLPVRRDLELEVGVRDLLHAHDEVQGHGGGGRLPRKFKGLQRAGGGTR